MGSTDERIIELALNHIDGKMEDRMLDFKQRFTPEKMKQMLERIAELEKIDALKIQAINNVIEANHHLQFQVQLLEEALKDMRKKALEVLRCESGKNELRRKLLELKDGYCEISGNFELNRAFFALAKSEEESTQALQKLEAMRSKNV